MLVRNITSVLAMVLIAGLLPLLADNSATQEQQSDHSERVEKYYRSIPNAKPKGRERAFYEARAYPFSRIPRNGIPNAIRHEQNMMGKSGGAAIMAAQPEWEAIGPFRVGGRIRSVVVHPTNGAIAYIGTAAGGIWRTTNHGESWEALFDDQHTLAFGSVAIDPNNPDVLYAGTGEMSSNIDAYLGYGIYKSTNGGDTWHNIGLTTVGAFSKILVHPANSNVIYAAATKNGAGFYRSDDGGQSWKRLLSQPVSDITLNQQNGAELFVGVSGVALFHTTDGGDSFTQLNSTQNGLPYVTLGRISVQQSRSNPDVIYSLMQVDTLILLGGGQSRNVFHAAIYKSTNRGRNWAKVYEDSPTRQQPEEEHYPFFRAQGWYDQYIQVHPGNPDIVLAGGIDIWRTEDGGDSWRNITNGYGSGPVFGGEFVHVDQHHAYFDPSDGNNVFVANDGGIFYSRDAGRTYSNRNNNLAITQFYGMAIDQSAESITFGGTQDNGNRSSHTSNDWGYIGGGDGGFVAVDYSNPDFVYGQDLASRNLIRMNIRTGQVSGINGSLDNVNDEGYWTSPIVVDPSDPFTLLHGRSTLYISFDKGLHWDPISTEEFPVLRENVDITTIAVSPLDNGVIWCGTEAGDVIVTPDFAISFQQVNGNGLVNRFVSDIACSPGDKQTAYVCYSGYGSGHVFKTTNLGQSWEDIGQALPDVPCNSIVLHPTDENIIFVGTDIGVYATYDGGTSWFPYGTGLPRSPVVDMEIHYSSNMLRVATHGRSMWQVGIPASVEAYEISSPAGGEIFTPSTRQVVSWYGFEGAVLVEFSTDDGESWATLANGAVGSRMSWQVPNQPTIYGRIRVSSISKPEQVRISPGFTISELASSAILKQESVGHVPYGIAYDGNNGLWTTSFYGNRVYKLNATTLLVESSFALPGNDSLYTDITIDRSNNTLYIHQMNTEEGNGGQIHAVSMDGNVLYSIESPAEQYPIGLAWVGNGRLVVGDRNARRLYLYEPASENLVAQARNPFQKNFGPRGLCYDAQTGKLYQASTDFTGSTLNATYNVMFSLDNMEVEQDRLELRSRSGFINARGIDYDPGNRSFWISDFSGNIYKIAGFDISLLVDVEEPVASHTESRLVTMQAARPNPFGGRTSVGFTLEESAQLHIELFNTAGNKVLDIAKGLYRPGSHTLEVDGTHLPNGVYTLSIRDATGIQAGQKIILVK